MKYRNSDGKLVFKVTNDRQVLIQFLLLVSFPI